jgi:anionic cell wall polymer biosynthesis LytR-Cps2A-Psr (LCP) family protein
MQDDVFDDSDIIMYVKYESQQHRLLFIRILRDTVTHEIDKIIQSSSLTEYCLQFFT